MDNMVMIQAGDLIDNTIGVRFGLATLAAAACGQIFSDVSGVAFGGVVEDACARGGLRTPDVSAAQRQLPKVKLLGTVGAICGVILGCCLGMTSLLFMDLNARTAASLSLSLSLGEEEERSRRGSARRNRSARTFRPRSA